jgi:hypothetical protein
VKAVNESDAPIDLRPAMAADADDLWAIRRRAASS